MVNLTGIAEHKPVYNKTERKMDSIINSVTTMLAESLLEVNSTVEVDYKEKISNKIFSLVWIMTHKGTYKIQDVIEDFSKYSVVFNSGDFLESAKFSGRSVTIFDGGRLVGQPSLQQCIAISTLKVPQNFPKPDLTVSKKCNFNNTLFTVYQLCDIKEHSVKDCGVCGCIDNSSEQVAEKISEDIKDIKKTKKSKSSEMSKYSMTVHLLTGGYEEFETTAVSEAKARVNLYDQAARYMKRAYNLSTSLTSLRAELAKTNKQVPVIRL